MSHVAPSTRVSLVFSTMPCSLKPTHNTFKQSSPGLNGIWLRDMDENDRNLIPTSICASQLHRIIRQFRYKAVILGDLLRTLSRNLYTRESPISATVNLLSQNRLATIVVPIPTQVGNPWHPAPAFCCFLQNLQHSATGSFRYHK